MTDRTQLVRLLNTIFDHNFHPAVVDLVKTKVLADHLIANGVRLESKQATSDENKRWIPVTERLPESNREPVLIALRWGEVDIGWCENERWGSEFVNEYDDCEVTHWMPLPEPPKEECR